MEQTAEQIIMQWKEEYGDIYVVHLGDFEFYCRLLTYQEYEVFMNQADDGFELDEMVVEACVLEPMVEDWRESIYGGYTGGVAQAIKEESLLVSKKADDGENPVRKMVEEGIEEVSQNFMRQIPLIIHRAFPSYRLDEIKEMNLRKQIELYTEAAWLIRELDGVDPSFEDEQEAATHLEPIPQDF